MSRRVVWAPRPERVELEVGSQRHVLERDGSGWWWSATDFDGEYRLVVDGDPLPDPRSPWQPAGVDGPSHTLDPMSFRWTDHGWRGRPLGSAVLYELHVGTFTEAGTFDAAIERLGELSDLGVDAIELMPVAEFPGRRGWGYDGVLLYAPHHAYGGPHGLQRFVDACHAVGMAVVLDVVYNHLGPAGNHLARFGPYFTDEYRTPWGDAVNLDQADSDEVRRFFIDNALTFVRDYHLDGIRLDAVHAFFDRSAVHFLEALSTEVHALGRQLGRQVWVIAESDLNDPRLVRSGEAGGLGLDASWSDDFHHAVQAVLTGECDGYYLGFGRLQQLAEALTKVYVHDGCYSALRRRRHGRKVGSLPRDRFLGYAQTHDQIGNRAAGERLVHLAGARRAQVAAALALTSPFVPMLFQGEEWAASTPFQYFTDHSDPELARAIREGRRNEFAALVSDESTVPDPQGFETFAASKLDWDERARSDHRAMLEWHRSLITLRRTFPDLTSASEDATGVTFDEEGRWIVVRRGSIDVAVNLGDTAQWVPVVTEGAVVLLSNDPHPDLGPAGVRAEPDGVVLIRPPAAGS